MWAVAVVFLLFIPLVLTLRGSGIDGMGWHWTLGDFVFAFVLLFGSALAFELIASKGGTVAYRAAVGIACAAILLLIWINAAVGIIGSEDNPANLLYGAVPIVLIIGAFLARLKPRGMMLALFVTALAQMMVPTVALLIWQPPFDPGVVQVFGLNGIFAILFAGSALLFMRADAMDVKTG
jgi:hypothetical protein